MVYRTCAVIVIYSEQVTQDHFGNYDREPKVQVVEGSSSFIQVRGSKI